MLRRVVGGSSPGVVLEQSLKLRAVECNFNLNSVLSKSEILGASLIPYPLSLIPHGHAPISADLAVRLEMAGIGTANVWLGVQANYSIW